MWTKSYSIFLLIWLFTIVSSSILEEKDDFDRKCVMGKTFYDGCNWCSCGSKHIACTLKACYDPETGGIHKPKKAPEDFWENSTEFLYKANLNGTIVSRETQHTRNMWTKSYSLFLLALLFTIVNSSVPEESRKCLPGKTFYDGCNSCFCAGGRKACTLKLCYDQTGAVLVPLKTPDDFWQ
ncbi:uncharacterized protein LOC143366408 [Andrena cerasifolii]|uniref:uncharacterized protein LOC143366408 n=1 Tax=Andrena cerasifolii TaxID=2819439 RepID=UPI004037B414